MGEWQPIETAPHDGTEFLGWMIDTDETNEDRGDGWWCLALWHSEEEHPGPLECPHGDSVKFTHWMPLPDPPRAHAPTPPDTPEEGA